MHSYSGRTLAAAKALAALTDAELIAFGDPPAPELPANGQQLATLPLWRDGLPKGVKRVFLGYPIWGYGAPSPPVVRLAEHLQWKDVEVVPFYTYSHDAQAAARDALCAVVARSGGRCLAHLDLQVDTWSDPRRVQALVRTAFLRQPGWWRMAPGAAPTEDCKDDEQGIRRCRISAGPAWVGDLPDSPDALPRQTWVGEIEMDAGEVTVQQWTQCVAAGHCPSGRGEQSFCATLIAAGRDRAMPCLSAADAARYCASRGMRLPTEAEWIRAARGSSAQAFPWGDALDAADPRLRGNFGEREGEGHPRYGLVPKGALWPKDGEIGLAAPCSFTAGNSPFGVCDLAGNLAEWTAQDGAIGLKGGMWFDNRPEAFHVGARAWYGGPPMADYPGSYVSGGRCVRTVSSPHK